MSNETPKPAEFQPAKMPPNVDMQIEDGKKAVKTLFHLLAVVWWAAKRERANEKMRKHSQYFENETAVTQFKRSLDEQPEIKEPEFRPNKMSEIVLQTRTEAEAVLDRLFALLDKYEIATVADLYELVGLQSAFLDQKRGWTDLLQVQVRPISGGWYIDLPEPKPFV